MPVNLSIKNAPDEVVTRLKQRAARNHRSLQGELMAIIEAAAREESSERVSPSELVARLRGRGLSSPSEAAAIVREERETRYGRRRR